MDSEKILISLPEKPFFCGPDFPKSLPLPVFPWNLRKNLLWQFFLAKSDFFEVALKKVTSDEAIKKDSKIRCQFQRHLV